MKGSEDEPKRSKKAIKGSEGSESDGVDDREGADRDLEETISKAADLGEKIGNIREKKPVSPESMLPPSSAVFLKEGDNNTPVTEPSPGPVDRELESRIVEKNLEPPKEKVKVNDAGPDPDLIEHHKDFSRRPRPKEKTPAEKRPDRPKEEPVPQQRPSPVKDAKPPPPRTASPRSRSVSERPGPSTPGAGGKFQPAVAGVADTNLKKCPNCGGFVNIAVSSTCFNCGYDIK